MAGERLMAALDIGTADLAQSSGPRNPVLIALGNISADQHVLRTAQKIPAAQLQDALLVLPFDRVCALLAFVDLWARAAANLPLTCRILFFVLKTHHRQIVAAKTMRVMLSSVRLNLRTALLRQKDQMGFNLAAVRFVGAAVEAGKTCEYVDEEALKEVEERSKRKRGFATLA